MARKEEIDPIKVGWLCDWPEPHEFHESIMQYAYDEAYAQGILDRPIEIVIRAPVSSGAPLLAFDLRWASPVPPLAPRLTPATILP
jgi:hypothetical protein